MYNYSGTKCPKCEQKIFELVEDAPTNSKWKYMYLRCTKCKTFLAILPYNNTNVMIEQLHDDVKKLKPKSGLY